MFYFYIPKKKGIGQYRAPKTETQKEGAAAVGWCLEMQLDNSTFVLQEKKYKHLPFTHQCPSDPGAIAFLLSIV